MYRIRLNPNQLGITSCKPSKGPFLAYLTKVRPPTEEVQRFHKLLHGEAHGVDNILGWVIDVPIQGSHAAGRSHHNVVRGNRTVTQEYSIQYVFCILYGSTSDSGNIQVE
jgi:hypothetical protein